VPYVQLHTPLPEIQTLFSECEENHLPVLDNDNKISGIVSLKNVRAVLFEKKLGHLLIAQDLKSPSVTVTPAESLRSALRKFLDYDYSQIPVVDFQTESQMLGLLSHEDVIEAYNKEIRRRKFTE